MAGNQIQFGIGFNVNEAGLNKLKQSLQEIQRLTANDLLKTGNFGTSVTKAAEQLNQIKASAREVQNALTKAFNPALGTTNIAKFSQELKGMNLGQVASQFNQLGVAGQGAFLQIVQQSLALNAPLKQNVGWLQKMGQTLTNQIKWHVASAAINGFTNSIQSSFNYVKALDASLTDIRIVTGQSRDEMAKFALEANNAAQALGRQTKEYTNAALSFYQQGLNDEEVRTRTEATLKAQNITGAGTEIADELTAVWNGFQVNIEGTEAAVDKLAAVADSSASNMSELATGMSKVASVANNMGVSIDQLTAQLATIIATTRQAPESVGNALKTIYTRINDIKTGSDEAEVSLGNYSSQMAKVGISVLDANGNLRDTGAVIEEIGGKWNTLSHEQQIYLARTMAGQRQMNNLIALFDNWTKYSDMLNVSLNAEGALNEKNARYMESLSAHVNQFKAAMEGLQDAMLDSDSLMSFYDAGTKVIEMLETFVHSLGGMRGLLLGIATIATSAFKNQIAEAIQVGLHNLRNYQQTLQDIQAQKEVLELFDMSSSTYAQLGENSGLKRAVDNIRQMKIEFSEYRDVMKQADQDIIDGLAAQQVEEEKVLLYYDEIANKATKMANASLAFSNEAGRAMFAPTDIFTRDENGLGVVGQQTELQGLIETLTHLKETYADLASEANSVVNSVLQDNEAFNRQDIIVQNLEQQLEQYNKYLDQSTGKYNFDQYKKITTKNGREQYHGPKGFISKDEYEAAKAAEQAVASLTERLQQETSALEDLGTLLNASEENLDKFKEKILQVANNENFFGENTEKVKTAINNLGRSGINQTAVLRELQQYFKEAGLSIDEFVASINNISPQVDSANNGIERIKASLAGLKQSFQDAQIGKSFAGLLQGISQVTMGIQTLSTALKTYQEIEEGTIDKSEGWLRVISSVSMGLPSLILGLSKMHTELSGVLLGLKNVITDFGMASIAAGGLSGKLAGAAASAGGLVSGLAALAPYVVIVAAIAGAVVLLYRHLTKADRELKEHQKLVDKSQKAADEAKTAYQNLKDTISDYQEARSAIGELVKGTEEWKDAIEKTQQKAEELLDLWPELIQTIKFDENGVPYWDQADLDAAQTASRKNAAIKAAKVAKENYDSYDLEINKAVADITGNNKKQVEQTKNIAELVVKDNLDNLKYVLNNFYDLYAEAERELAQEAFDKGEPYDATPTQIRNYLKEKFDLEQYSTTLQDNLGYNIDEVLEFVDDQNKSWNNLITLLDQRKTQNEVDFNKIQAAVASYLSNYGDKNGGLVNALLTGLITDLDLSTIESDDIENEIEKILEQGDKFKQKADKIRQIIGDNKEVENAIISFIGGRQGTFSTTMDAAEVALAQKVLDQVSVGFENVAYQAEASKEAKKAWEEAFDQIIPNLSQGLPEQMQESLQKTFDSFKFKSLVSPDQANNLMKGFRTALIRGLDIDSLTSIFDELPENKIQEFLDLFDDINKDITFDELLSQIDELNIASLDTADSGLQQLLKVLLQISNAAPGATKTVEDITSAYGEVNAIVKDLKQGDTINKDKQKQAIEEYFSGSKYSLEDYFELNDEGNLELMRNATELQAALRSIEFTQLSRGLRDIYNQAEALIEELPSLFTKEALIPENSFTNELLTTDVNANWYQNAAMAAVEYGKAHFTDGDQLQQILSIQNRLENGEILSQEDLNLINQTSEALRTAQEQMIGLVDKSKDFSKILDDISIKKPLDSDINEDEWKKLSEYLAKYGDTLEGVGKDIKNNKFMSEQLAEEMLRYDDALKDVTDHYEDWMDALNSKKWGRQYKAMQELRDVYADLLDMQPDQFNEGFLQSTENLELLQKALTGTEEEADAAYEALDELARGQLLDNLKIDIIPELSDQFYDGLADVQNILNDESLTVGVAIDGESSFYDSINNMIAALGGGEEAANSLLDALAIDAELEPNEEPLTSTTPSGFDTTLIPQASPFALPVGSGSFFGGMQSGTVILPSAVYTPREPVETTTTQAVPTVRVKNGSASKKAGGNFKRGHSGGGGGKKGGGGGGGGNKAKKPNKPFKSKIDPYHDVNIKIGNVKEGLDKLQKERDKLIGKDAVDNLTKQINLMEKEKDLLKEKAGIAQEELKRQGQELANLGAIFDSNNDIANYKDLLLNKQNQINEAIRISNTLEDEERDAYDDYIKDLEQEYKDLETAIKEYDETQQLLDDLDLDFQDLINQQIELAIEAFDLEINVKLDLKDAKKEFNEFRKKVIDQVKDDQYGALAAATARNYENYYSVDEQDHAAGLVNDLRQHLNEIRRETEIVAAGGFSQVYGNDLAAAAEDLKKYNDELMSALEEAQEVIDETHDHFLDAIDAMQEAFETQQDNLNKIDDLLSHDMEILQLIHGEENYDEMANLWIQQINQDNIRLRALQEQQKYWQDRLNEYEKGTDEWKKAMENWQAAFEATNEAMITSVQNLQSQWENSINSIMSSLRNQTFGGNMDAALADWDKLVWHSDRYLDSIERANGLLDLQKNYIDTINKTNDPKLQAKLAELEEKQLDALSQKEHLREIDLKLAQQQLTVLQAQMALEDAQQAKTKLRLRRDSQGNYTYQYVADEDEIAEKTQEYIKSLNEYRTMANESLRQDLEDLRDYTLEYYDALQEAQMKYGDNTAALLEEQDRLYELYFGDDGYITNLHLDAISSMSDAQEAMFNNLFGLNTVLSEDLFNKFLGPDSEMVTAVHELLDAGGEIPSLIDSFINDSADVAFDHISDKTIETLRGPEGMLPEWSSALWNIAEQYDNEFVPRIINAMNYLQQANQAYVDGLAVMQNAANRTTEQIAMGLAYDTYYTGTLNEATKELLETQAAELDSAAKVYDALKKNEQAFKDSSQAAIDAANANFLYWLSLNGMTASGLPYSIDGIQGKVQISNPSVGSAYSSSGGDDSSGGGGGGGSGDSGGSNPKSTTNDKLYGIAANAAGAAIQYAQKYGTGNWKSTASGPQRLKSGGYTGSWGEAPRLAWLDEKELVLNDRDTENMLNAVAITRTIFDRVQNAAGSLSSTLRSGGALDLVAAAGQTILQDVIINADFPAVQDASQIKQAFNELINLASQRASTNRKNG